MKILKFPENKISESEDYLQARKPKPRKIALQLNRNISVPPVLNAGR